MGEVDSGRRRKWVAPLVVGFGVFHACHLLLALLPESWLLNHWFKPYRLATGSEQRWRVFETIPRITDRVYSVEVVDGDGGREVVGPVLPGLEPFKLDKRIRYYALLENLLAPERDYFEHYIDSLDRAIDESSDLSGAVSFEIRVDTDYIRTLEMIEEDGELSTPRTEFIGPFSVGGDR